LDHSLELIASLLRKKVIDTIVIYKLYEVSTLPT
jgi:hypothetical protein